jgi:hypothetical protein
LNNERWIRPLLWESFLGGYGNVGGNRRTSCPQGSPILAWNACDVEGDSCRLKFRKQTICNMALTGSTSGGTQVGFVHGHKIGKTSEPLRFTLRKMGKLAGIFVATPEIPAKNQSAGGF